MLTRTPDEIKKGLECRKRNFSDSCYDRCATCELFIPCYGTVERCVDALTLIQQLETQNAELSGKIGRLESQNRCFKENKESCEKRMIDLAQRMPRWISVEERLPEIDAEVLIYTNEGLYDVAQYSGGERFWTLERNPDCWVTALGVTHWMPLPEPPNE